jgi:chemotaxis protein CheC
MVASASTDTKPLMLLSNIERDALKEVANIGAGQSSSVLSELVHCRVDLVVSDIDFISLHDVVARTGTQHRNVVGTYTPVIKGIDGNMIVLISMESAVMLAGKINSVEHPGAFSVSTQRGKEIMTRIGDILAGSYINALNQFLDMHMQYDKTGLVTTFGESIIDLIVLSVNPGVKNALLIKTSFSIQGTEIRGEFMLLLAAGSLDSVLHIIRQKLRG